MSRRKNTMKFAAHPCHAPSRILRPTTTMNFTVNTYQALELHGNYLRIHTTTYNYKDIPCPWISRSTTTKWLFLLICNPSYNVKKVSMAHTYPLYHQTRFTCSYIPCQNNANTDVSYLPPFYYK